MRPFSAYRVTFPRQPPDESEPACLLRWRLGVGQQHHHAGPAHRGPAQPDRTAGRLRGPAGDVQPETGGTLIALPPLHGFLRVRDARTGVVHPHRHPAVAPGDADLERGALWGVAEDV